MPKQRKHFAHRRGLRRLSQGRLVLQLPGQHGPVVYRKPVIRRLIKTKRTKPCLLTSGKREGQRGRGGGGSFNLHPLSRPDRQLPEVCLQQSFCKKDLFYNRKEVFRMCKRGRVCVRIPHETKADEGCRQLLLLCVGRVGTE